MRNQFCLDNLELQHVLKELSVFLLFLNLDKRG